ncbi:MAG: dihydrofolate reductase [Marmoricola sp.]|nr:dihydrofolate reductase [Marmoricola sp.]
MLTQYFTACSLDGFIASDPEDGLTWLEVCDGDPDGPQGYNAFIAEVGALVMGATTYQWVLDHQDGPWPYEIPVWVVTHRTFPQPTGDVRFSSAPIPEIHTALVEAARGRNVWLAGGGDLVGQFHDHGLLDEIWVQQAPVMLGAGAPLLPRRIELEQIELVENGDFACRRLRVKR